MCILIFHQSLFPFSSKFPDVNFAPYAHSSEYVKPVRDTNGEPGLPVMMLEFAGIDIRDLKIPRNRCTGNG